MNKYNKELWDLMDDDTKKIMSIKWGDKPIPPPIRICTEYSLTPIAYKWRLGDNNWHKQVVK